MKDGLRRGGRWLLVSLLLAGTACSDKETQPTLLPLEVPEGCNPLASENDCLLPFPSDHFLAEDPALPSGHRVKFPDAVKLKAQSGALFDFTDLHPADGWSHGTPFIQATKMVVLTVDWWGMSNADAPGVLAAMGGEPGQTLRFTDRVHQAMVNQIAVTQAARTMLKQVATLQQTGFDRIDPLTYAPHVLTSLYPGAPASRRLLVQYGLGDAQVPNVATELHARTPGLVQQLPATHEVPALPHQQGAMDGSALVQFDFQLPEPLPGTVADLPAQDNPVHEGVRRDAAGRDQVDRFLRPDGRVEVR